MAPYALQAEVRGMPISALKHVSASVLDKERLGGVRGLQAAEPYPDNELKKGGASERDRVPPEAVEGGKMGRQSALGADISGTRLVSATMVPVLDGAACERALRLVVDVATMAYQHEQRKEYMAVVAQAVLVDDVVRANGLPNLNGFRGALGNLPWFGDLREQVQVAGAAVLGRCQAVGGKVEVAPKVPVGTGVSWPE